MIAVVLACRAPPEAGDPRAVIDPVVEVDPTFPTVATVRWDTELGGTSRVEVLRDDRVDHVTPTADAPAVTVLGLAGGATYALVPVQVAPDGEEHRGPPLALTVAAPPEDLPDWDGVATDPARLDPARFVLLSMAVAGTGWVAILDRAGDWVWWWRIPDGLQVVIAEPSTDGRSVLALETDAGQEVDRGALVRIPVRGGPEARTATLLAHHDFAELPDGRVAWLSYDVRTGEINGRELALRAEKILEGGEGSADPPDERFAVFDDYPREPFFPCSHALRTDGSPIGEAHDWTHGNSLVWSAPSDAFYFHARYLDALLKIDRASGAIVWQLGGLDNAFAVEGGAPLWSHGHTSQVWEGGMTMFDNGDHADPPLSAAVEYAWDEGGHTVREVWRHPHPEGHQIGVLGDVKRLSNGHHLVAWGNEAVIDEVTDEGVAIWTASGPADILGRVTALLDLYALAPSGP